MTGQTISPKSLSHAVTHSVKAIDLMDQASSKVIGTQLLNYTPVKWFSSDKHYTTSAMDPSTFRSPWHLVKAYSQISVSDAINYASSQPNIKFFAYVNPGGYWNEFGKGDFKPYTALFFSYDQPAYAKNPAYLPGGIHQVTIYFKVDYINQHVLNAKKHSSTWKSSMRSQILGLLKEVADFGDEFERRYPSLQSLADKIGKGNQSAVNSFKDELRALQQLTRQAAQRTKSKDSLMANYLEALAKDAREFTADQDKISSQMAGLSAEIQQLKANIEEYEKQRKKSLLIDIFVPIMGIIDAAKGSSEKLEHELRQQEYQLQTNEKEIYHLKAISGRLNGMVNSARVEHASVFALINGWDTLNADFGGLIDSEKISTDYSLWLADLLSDAKTEWLAVKSQVRAIAPN